MDSGVSIASRSSMVAVEVDDCTSWAAFSWASVTLRSASSMNLLRTSYLCKRQSRVDSHKPSNATYLDRSDVGVLRRVLVGVKTVLCGFPLFQIDTELDEQEHHRLDGGDGVIPRPLGCDMLVEDR